MQIKGLFRNQIDTFKSIMSTYVSVPSFVLVIICAMDIMAEKMGMIKPYFWFLSLFIQNAKAVLLVYTVPAIIAAIIVAVFLIRLLKYINKEEEGSATIQ